MTGKKYIFGNWKMAQSRSKALEFSSRWSFENPSVEVAVFPSFVHLCECLRERKNSLKVGAQDCSTEMEGAFTGEVSARFLAEMSVDYVLVGHSERRARFKEDVSQIAQKLHQLSLVGVTPVFCLGESLEARKSGKVFDVLSEQLGSLDQFKGQVIVAYEPVWAIGTGVSAEPSQIAETHAWLAQKLGSLPILYGGSVKPENAESILKIPHVDGLLIGGASLSRENLEQICRIAQGLSA